MIHRWRQLRRSLLAALACPVDGSRVGIFGGELICLECGWFASIEELVVLRRFRVGGRVRLLTVLFPDRVVTASGDGC